jgi:SAM-dependent methyltransferase
MRSEILPLIEGYRELTTLDVGCGEGVTSAMFRERGIARTTLGIEYSPQAAARARRRNGGKEYATVCFDRGQDNQRTFIKSGLSSCSDCLGILK